MSIVGRRPEIQMRVLVVTNMYPSAANPGSGVFIEQQVKGLIARGIALQVLFVDRRREGPWIYYRMQPMLRRCLAEFAPNLIHVIYGGVMAHQLCSFGSLPPVVVTFHGSDLLGENLSGLLRRLISHYGIYCSKKAACRAQGVIVVARHLLERLGARRPKTIEVLPCGIDLEKFRPLDQGECRTRLGWAADTFHVLFATSAGDPVKRPELARAAVVLFEQAGKRIQFHVLSGVSNSEVPTWLNASDVLLLTSKHEGSPTVVKEALACGLPVVSVPVGDVPERIADIPGCYLAEPDPKDLASKLNLVCASRRRLDCRDRLRDLACPAVAARLEQFYDEVLSDSVTAEIATRRNAAFGPKAQPVLPAD